VAEQDRGSDDPQLAAIARHALHDEELIAAYAAEDIEDQAESARARALVERCEPCRDLHRDLSAIRAATRASGTAAQRASTLTAPRDFRLTAEDAARLRPGTPIGRIAVRLGWRARVGLGVAAFGRPVGAALATFGVVGLLIGSLTLGGTPLASMMGAAGASPAPGNDQTGTTPESTTFRVSLDPEATSKDEIVPPANQGTSGNGASGGSLALFAGSAALLVLGAGLILAARRTPGRFSPQRGN